MFDQAAVHCDNFPSRYNKPHMWVTYKNGARAPYAYPVNLCDRVVAVARGRHLRGSVERPCVACKLL